MKLQDFYLLQWFVLGAVFCSLAHAKISSEHDLIRRQFHFLPLDRRPGEARGHQEPEVRALDRRGQLAVVDPHGEEDRARRREYEEHRRGLGRLHRERVAVRFESICCWSKKGITRTDFAR